MNFGANPRIINSVFSKNSSLAKGGAIYILEGDSVRIFNSILWGNTASEGGQIYSKTFPDFPQLNGWVASSNSIVEGGMPENSVDQGGNLNIDPVFNNPLGEDGIAGTLDDDLRLQSGSPAIDQGNNSVLPLDIFDVDFDGIVDEIVGGDLDDNQRVYDSGIGIPTVDIGAYEFNAPPVGVGIENYKTKAGGQDVSISVYPNPAKHRVLIDIQSPVSQPITVSLHDILGRQGFFEFSGFASQGNNSVYVDISSLASGLYFLRLSLDGEYITYPIVVNP